MPCETVTHFALKTIMPATDWRAVYHDEGMHHLAPVYALALAERRTRNARTLEPLPARLAVPEDEVWEIVALDYDPCSGWSAHEERENCCGLLPPDMPLEVFEEITPCGHARAKQAAL